MKYRDIEVAAVTVHHIERLERYIRETEFEKIGEVVNNDLLQEAAEKQLLRSREKLRSWGVEIPISTTSKEPKS